MAARRPTSLVCLAASGVLALALAACSSQPATVLDTDLPQVPNMTGRESSDIRQAEGKIEQGTFAYKGGVESLPERVKETKSRFAALGWALYSERLTPATARLVFTKDTRRAVVEIVRNDLSPGMSTAVTTVATGSTATTGESQP